MKIRLRWWPQFKKLNLTTKIFVIPYFAMYILWKHSHLGICYEYDAYYGSRNVFHMCL